MNQKPRDEGRGGTSRVNPTVYVRLAVGMIAFGSATPVSKIVTDAMPPFIGSLCRVAIGALVLLPFVIGDLGQIKTLGKRDWFLIGCIALFGMFGFSALMLYGMALVTGVVGAIVMSTTPAVTATASMIFLGDRPTWRKITAVTLAVAGVLILYLGRSGGDSGGSTRDLIFGSLLVFGAVGCEAAYTLLGKRMSEEVDPVVVAFLAAALSLPLFVPLALWQWNRFDAAAMDVRSWLALAWYGAGTLALGSWLWYTGVKRTEGAVAAGFMGLMPVSALVLSYVLLGEAFAWMHLAGFGVVFGGVLLISWEHARMSDEE